MKLLGVGADPEFFVSNGQSIVSAIGKVGGTKKSPKLLGAPNYFVQEDNVLAELNIPPARSGVEFSENIKRGIKLVTAILPKDHSLVIKASHTMDASQLRSAKAKAIGCDPEIMAWTKETVAPEFNLAEPNLRTASGHVHISYENPTEEKNFDLVKILDIFLGVPSVILDPDKTRRRLYGKSGSFRHKPYGLEYRTLSSFWTADPVLQIWVFSQIELALQAYSAGLSNKLSVTDGYDIQFAINFYDETLAKQIIKKYGIQLP